MNCIMNLFEEISSPILNNVMVIRTPLEGIYQASPELREDEKIFFFSDNLLGTERDVSLGSSYHSFKPLYSNRLRMYSLGRDSLMQ